jgi:hypothetical protein
LAEANFVLHAWLRSGNTGAGQGAAQFLSEALSLLGAQHWIRCVRADSGFYADSFLSFLEERQLTYIVGSRKSDRSNHPRTSIGTSFQIAGLSHGVESGYWAQVQFEWSVPTIKDRVAPLAAIIVLEAIFKANLTEEQYAY